MVLLWEEGSRYCVGQSPGCQRFVACRILRDSVREERTIKTCFCPYHINYYKKKSTLESKIQSDIYKKKENEKKREVILQQK